MENGDIKLTVLLLLKLKARDSNEHKSNHRYIYASIQAHNYIENNTCSPQRVNKTSFCNTKRSQTAYDWLLRKEESM